MKTREYKVNVIPPKENEGWARWTIDAFAWHTLQAAKAYFSNPENGKKYIVWHYEKYGKLPNPAYGVDPKLIQETAAEMGVIQ